MVLAPDSLLFTFLLISPSFNPVAAAFGAQSNRVFVSTPVSNYPKRSVAECMSTIPKDHILTPDMSVEETMAILLRHGLASCPVVNKDHQLIGIVTSFDFLQQEAFEGSLLPVGGTAADVEMYVEAAKKICGQCVADVMTSNPYTISPETPMRVAAARMASMRLHQFPVVDEATQTLIGILTTADVMRDLHHIVRNLPESKDDIGVLVQEIHQQQQEESTNDHHSVAFL